MGGKVKGIYWTMGAYVVTVTEAPDDQTATAGALKVASLGNVRTTTVRGFDMEEIETIIQKAD